MVKTNTDKKNTISEKITKLEAQLKSLKKVAIAFSGGKDSYFLLKMALKVLGKENVAVFNVNSTFTTQNDDKRIEYFRGLLDFDMTRLDIDISGERIIMSNPIDRCYHCKLRIFKTIREAASGLGIEAVLDGSTYSDLKEYRPGMKAIHELGVLSPLEKAGITTGEIVEYLKVTDNVEDYYVTSSTCLATRFPYDFQLDTKLLNIFDRLESFFTERGIFPLKVRYIPDGIRIETPVRNFAEVLVNREEILDYCKGYGIKFITLDLEGIRSGVWDPVPEETVKDVLKK